MKGKDLRPLVAGKVLLMILLIAVTACRRGGTVDQPLVLSPEDERLAMISMMDSTTIPALVDLNMIEGADELDSLTADAWMLIDDATGFIISQKNARGRHFIASLTKVMTCQLALEHGCMDDTIVITDDVYVARNSRTKLGDSYLMGNLVDEMMLTSDNDAAYALAKHIAGDTLRFCEMMNAKANYLGMSNTNFANPNGMPNSQNYSTAFDMMRLSRYCMHDSTFAQIVGTAEKDIPLIDGRHLPCQNTNMLLTTYEGCIGVKTGYTRQAGNCLISAAHRDGTTLLFTFLMILPLALISTRLGMVPRISCAFAAA